MAHPCVVVLKKARKKIANKKNWTQRRYARDKNDYDVLPDDPRAVKFCAIGAIKSIDAYPPVRRAAIGFLSVAAFAELGENDIISLNDGRGGHGKIMLVYDSAIKNAQNYE